MYKIVTSYVERNGMPGIVTPAPNMARCVWICWAQVVGDARMRRDTIFWITAMTKPITTAVCLELAQRAAAWERLLDAVY